MFNHQKLYFAFKEFIHFGRYFFRAPCATCLTVVTTKPAVVYLRKTSCPQNAAVSLIYETELHIPPLPLAGKCYFSALPCACHLVPPIPDGINTVQLHEQSESWCSGVRTSPGDCLQEHEASCVVGRPGVASRKHAPISWGIFTLLLYKHFHKSHGFVPVCNKHSVYTRQAFGEGSVRFQNHPLLLMLKWCELRKLTALIPLCAPPRFWGQNNHMQRQQPQFSACGYFCHFMFDRTREMRTRSHYWLNLLCWWFQFCL